MFSLTFHLFMIITGIGMIISGILILSKNENKHNEKKYKTLLICGILLSSGFLTDLCFTFYDLRNIKDQIEWEKIKDDCYQLNVNNRELFMITIVPKEKYNNLDSIIKNNLDTDNYVTTKKSVTFKQRKNLNNYISVFSRQTKIKKANMFFIDTYLSDTNIFQDVFFLQYNFNYMKLILIKNNYIHGKK